MRNDIRNTTTAVLLAILQTPLDQPIRLALPKGTGLKFFAAVRVKLSRERKAALRRRIEFVDFMLSLLEHDTSDTASDKLVCVRTLSRQTWFQESSKIEMALRRTSLHDRKAIAEMLERKVNYGYEKGDEPSEKWRSKAITEFDAIGYAAQFAATNGENEFAATSPFATASLSDADFDFTVGELEAELGPGEDLDAFLAGADFDFGGQISDLQEGSASGETGRNNGAEVSAITSVAPAKGHGTSPGFAERLARLRCGTATATKNNST